MCSNQYFKINYSCAIVSPVTQNEWNITYLFPISFSRNLSVVSNSSWESSLQNTRLSIHITICQLIIWKNKHNRLFDITLMRSQERSQLHFEKTFNNCIDFSRSDFQENWWWMFSITSVAVGNLWLINVNSGREVFTPRHIGGIEIHGPHSIDSWVNSRSVTWWENLESFFLSKTPSFL